MVFDSRLSESRSRRRWLNFGRSFTSSLISLTSRMRENLRFLVLRMFPWIQSASSAKRSTLCQLIMRIAVQSNRISTLSNMASADSATVTASIIIRPMSSSMPSRLWRKANAKVPAKSAMVVRVLPSPMCPHLTKLRSRYRQLLQSLQPLSQRSHWRRLCNAAMSVLCL